MRTFFTITLVALLAVMLVACAQATPEPAQPTPEPTEAAPEEPAEARSDDSPFTRAVPPSSAWVGGATTTAPPEP